MNKKKSVLLICALLVAVALVAGSIFMVQRQQHAGNGEVEKQSFETPFGDLQYPQQWQDRIQVDVQSGDAHATVSFSGLKDNGTLVPLFDVLFGQQEGSYIGTMDVGKGKIVEVCLKVYELEVGADWSDDDIYALYAMQEDLNVVIEQLPLMEESAAELVLAVDPPQAEYPDMVIETAYGELFFPGRWEPFLRVEHTEQTAVFYGTEEGLPEQHLFDVCFDSQDQDPIGYLKTGDGTEVPVSILFYELQGTEAWSQQQLDTMLFMQEDANYLIGKLLPVSAVNEQTVLVETPFCDLEYPAKWEQYLGTEKVENGDYTVSFAAKLPGKNTVALFDIVFGNSGRIPVGSLTAKDGTAVPVTLTPYDISFDSSWTAEEQNIVYEMAENMNVVLQKLSLISQ